MRNIIPPLLFIGLLIAEVNANTLQVPSDYPTIQEAMDAAVYGDVVVVANGTYTGPGNTDLNFQGKAFTVKSENGPDNCTIDCQGTSEDPHRGFVFRSHEGADSVIDGFTIINGFGPYDIQSFPGLFHSEQSFVSIQAQQSPDAI